VGPAWRHRLVALGIAAIALGASPARAHDSMAPAGELHQWLPNDRWLQEHWIPFDRRRLETALGLHGSDLESFLVNDHHTLAALARQRGVDVQRLADELVAPWPAARRAELRGRTMQILTQGHLAQHVFFHVFHSLGSSTVAADLFGVSADELDALRLRRRTPLDVALEHGKDEAGLTAGLVRLLRSHRDAGVARGESWPAEADRMLARQVATLPCWLQSLRPSMDWGSPYGKALAQHGAHARGWPSTPAELRIDDRRVHRFWRRLRWTCWPRVPDWRRPAGAVTASASAVAWPPFAGTVRRRLHCDL
jgi:hypothetical protein